MNTFRTTSIDLTIQPALIRVPWRAAAGAIQTDAGYSVIWLN